MGSTLVIFIEALPRNSLNKVAKTELVQAVVR